MQAFCLAWPIERRSASQLARELDVDRTTCQRLVSLATNRFDPGAMLESMPGPRALRSLIDATRALSDRPPTDDVLAGLRSAVDSFDEFLRESAGSISSLKRRIAASPAVPIDADDDQAREALFNAAACLTGRHANATASVGLYDDIDVNENELRHIRVTANQGLVARPDAVPMLLEAFDGSGQAREDKWQRTPALVRELTSADWRPVKLPQTASFTGQAVEIAHSETPSDVVMYTAFPVPEPLTITPPTEESWFLINCPTRALVFDLYLHESVARRCTVSLDVHLWRANFANDPHGHWHTRMPHAPSSINLGRNADPACDLHPNHVELTRDLFTRASADPRDYIGFRCLQPFPIWRVGYRFLLDFGSLTA